MKDWGWAGSAGLETRGRLLLCVRVVSESHAVTSYLRLSAAGKGLGEDTARARTRRANRSHPSVAPMLGSRARKKRPQHALLVGTRYSPSRKPFLKRRGRVLRYLMRPVPVVRRPMALRPCIAPRRRAATSRCCSGRARTAARGTGGRALPRRRAGTSRCCSGRARTAAREMPRARRRRGEGSAFRGKKKLAGASRERDLSLPCRVAGRDTHSFACGRWGSRTRHRWPFGCGRIGVHTCWVGRSTGGGMAVRRRSRDMKFTRSRGNPRNDRGICERRRRLARTLARTLTCGTACATCCAVYRSSRSLFRFSPWLKSNRRDARRIKG